MNQFGQSADGVKPITHPVHGGRTMVIWNGVQVHARSVAGWAVALLGFSLPISTSLDGVLLVITVIAWTISGAFFDLPRVVRANWSVLLLPGLFVLIAVGMVHGLVPLGEKVRSLWKYDDLLLLLVFTPLLLDPQVRTRGLWAYGVSMGVTLILSLGLVAGWIPKNPWLHGNSANAVVFKLQITHNELMAFAALLFAEVAARRPILWQRYSLGLLALGAVIDVFMFVEGRTGQAILCVLIVLWCERRFGIRGMLMGVMAGVLLVGLAYAVSPVFQKRVDKTIREMEQAQVDQVAPKGSSIGLRMEWYKNTMQLITTSPLVGVGTGSFAQAYREMVTDPRAVQPAQPHNQYLLTAAELGVGGAGVLVGLFGLLWWKLRSMRESLYAQLGQGAVIMMVVGCLFNSLLVDHAEGLFFAWMVSAAFASGIGEMDGQRC